MNKYTQTQHNRRRSTRDRRKKQSPPYKRWFIIGLLSILIICIQIFRIKKNHKPWQGPQETVLYATLSNNGAVITYAFLADHKMVITKSFQGKECIVLAEYTGIMGSKVLGNNYHIKINNDWSWRQHYKNVESGLVPLSIKIHSLETKGDYCNGLPFEGRPREFYFEIGSDYMKFNGNTFIKLLDPAIAGLNEEEVLDYFKGIKIMQ